MKFIIDQRVSHLVPVGKGCKASVDILWRNTSLRRFCQMKLFFTVRANSTATRVHDLFTECASGRIDKIQQCIKKLFYCLTFPLFDLIGKYSLVIALFTKPEWKPIPHCAAIGIDEIQSDPTRNPCRVTEKTNCENGTSSFTHGTVNAGQSSPKVPDQPDPLTRHPNSPSVP